MTYVKILTDRLFSPANLYRSLSKLLHGSTTSSTSQQPVFGSSSSISPSQRSKVSQLKRFHWYSTKVAGVTRRLSLKKSQRICALMKRLARMDMKILRVLRGYEENSRARLNTVLCRPAVLVMWHCMKYVKQKR